MLGIGLITPNTILTILALKLYFSHNRLKSTTNDSIEAKLEKLQIEIGRNLEVAEIPTKEKYWNII